MENHSNIKISILVPVYGVEKYIGQCARTLFEQDYQNIEYVFVNDCTKDRSIEVLQETLKAYPHRVSQVKIINHEVNKGLSAARNTALENSSGVYVMPFDSDDFLSCNTAVSELMAKAASEDDDAVFYDMQSFPQKSHFPQFKIETNPYTLTQKILARETYMNVCGGIYKASLFFDNGIRSIEGISMGEDYAIKPRLTYYMKKIGYIAQPFYCYRVNTSSITKCFKSSHIDNLRSCVDGFYQFFETKSDYKNFHKYIMLAEIRCKIECVRLWLYNNGTQKDFDRINSLFPRVNISGLNLSHSEYLIYKLATYNMPDMIKFISKIKHKLNL